MSEHVCYYCRRPIPADIVRTAAEHKVPVCCPCRPELLGDMQTLVVEVKHEQDH